jgi:uncharacterized membrane protein
VTTLLATERRGGFAAAALACSLMANVMAAQTVPVAGDAEFHAFSWTQAGGIVDLGTLGGTHSNALAVNANGQIVGDAATAGDAADRAVLWNPMLPAPTSKNQCMNGGWKNFADANGTPFTNQGQCVAYTNHQ